MTKQTTHQYIKWGVGLLWFIFILATIVNTKHQSFNLEPYPDALFYISSARSFAQHNVLSFENQSNFKPAISPVYPLLLSAAYRVSFNPMAFVFINAFLGIVGVYFFWSLTSELKPTVRISGLLLFFSYGLWWWLPSIALSENVLWVLTLAAAYLARQYDTSKSKLSLALMVLVGLTICSTKFSAIPLGFVIIIFSMWQLIRPFRPPYVISCMTLAFIVVCVSFSNQLRGIVEMLLFAKYDFFKFDFVIPNAIAYLKILFGFTTRMIWQPLSFVTPGISFAMVVATWFTKKRHIRFLHTLLWSQLPLLLVFYDVNARYLIATLPLIILLTLYGLQSLFGSKKRGKTRIHTLHLAVFITIVATLLSQAHFFSLIVRQTIFRSSRAWQYEAVLSSSDALKLLPQDSVLLTALPPQLFSFYQPSVSHQVLPLSAHQEFLDKDINVWPSFETFPNLETQVSALLSSGKRVFVTNAYITHRQEVIHDFEALKKQYRLNLISEGCDHACDLYELTVY